MVCEFSRISAALGFVRRSVSIGSRGPGPAPGASTDPAARVAPGMARGFAPIPAALGFLWHFRLRALRWTAIDPPVAVSGSGGRGNKALTMWP
jgi:hypothetical protein